MEINYDNDDDCMYYQPANYYMAYISGNRSLCIVCQVDEPEDECWTRCQFKCGHTFHSRCIRKWCGRKQEVNCPLCGDIPLAAENRFCMLCGVFGHNDELDSPRCPEVRRIMKIKSPVRMKTKKRKP